MPLRLVLDAKNAELKPELFYTTAQMLVGNPFVFCLYGLDEQGVIKAGVHGYFNPMDTCLYLENVFNVSLKDKGLLDKLKTMKSIWKAVKVKNLRSKIIEVGE